MPVNAARQALRLGFLTHLHVGVDAADSYRIALDLFSAAVLEMAQIDVLSETSARARSYYLFLTVHGLDHWGRYLDEFAPVDGRWLITHRREMTDAAYVGGWGAGASGDEIVGHLTRPLEF